MILQISMPVASCLVLKTIFLHVTTCLSLSSRTPHVTKTHFGCFYPTAEKYNSSNKSIIIDFIYPPQDMQNQWHYLESSNIRSNQVKNVS